jgi:hypothetical protein
LLLVIRPGMRLAHARKGENQLEDRMLAVNVRDEGVRDAVRPAGEAPVRKCGFPPV